MATIWQHLRSYLFDNNPGALGTYGDPAAPTTGDTDWSGVPASDAALDDFVNMTDGQLEIGKSGTAAISNPSSAPTLAANTGGSLASGTYEVVYTYINTFGETQPSPAGSITFASGSTNKIDVSAITPLPTGATQAQWYISDAPGSTTHRYLTANSGAAFSITSLGLPGQPEPPSSNTTGSSNHTVKATLTGGAGINVTNGPGSITLDLNPATGSDIGASVGLVKVTGVQGVPFDAGTPTNGQGYIYNSTSGHAEWGDLAGGGTTINSGTSFPGSPSDGDLFIRTDTTPKGLYRYNLGTTTWDLTGDGTGLSSSLTSAHIFVGNGSNVATDVAVSGDASISNTGAVTVSKINGVSISGTPTTGQVPTATSGTTATWQTPSGGGGTTAFANVTNAADQTIPHATMTTLTFTAENFDPVGFHSNTTNPSRLTVPTGYGGYYLVSVSFRATVSANALYQVLFRKNTSFEFAIGFIPSVTGYDTYPCFTAPVVALADGDWVEVAIYQTTGSNSTVRGTTFLSATYSPVFSILKVG